MAGDETAPGVGDDVEGELAVVGQVLQEPARIVDRVEVDGWMVEDQDAAVVAAMEVVQQRLVVGEAAKAGWTRAERAVDEEQEGLVGELGESTHAHLPFGSFPCLFACREERLRSGQPEPVGAVFLLPSADREVSRITGHLLDGEPQQVQDLADTEPDDAPVRRRPIGAEGELFHWLMERLGPGGPVLAITTHRRLGEHPAHEAGCVCLQQDLRLVRRGRGRLQQKVRAGIAAPLPPAWAAGHAQVAQWHGAYRPHPGLLRRGAQQARGGLGDVVGEELLGKPARRRVAHRRSGRGPSADLPDAAAGL